MTLKSRLPQIIRELGVAANLACKKSAEEIKANRDPRTPVSTGALLSSGTVREIPEGWEFVEGSGLPDRRAWYTEFGTRKMAPRPHVLPAVAEVDHVENVRKAVQAVIDENTV